MNTSKRLSFIASLAICATLLGHAQTAVPTPEQFFGFQMGTDSKLARWDKIVDYMRQVSTASVFTSISNQNVGPSRNTRPPLSLTRVRSGSR